MQESHVERILPIQMHVHTHVSNTYLLLYDLVLTIETQPLVSLYEKPAWPSQLPPLVLTTELEREVAVNVLFCSL